MIKYAWLHVLTIMISCTPAEVKQDTFISLTSADISLCKNVAYQRIGDSLSSFTIKENYSVYVLPFKRYLHDTALSEDRFDCYKYASEKGVAIDKTHAFIWGKADSLASFINKNHILYIFNNEKVGDLIEFHVDRNSSLIYFPKDGKLYVSAWNDVINDKNKISENWYLLKR